MPAVHGGQPFCDVARRWHALAERRLVYYYELYRSGRWRHYYAGEEQFAVRLLEVVRATKIWAELADQRPADKDTQTTKDRDNLRPAA